MKKRLLSILVMLAMLASFVPLTAMADNDVVAQPSVENVKFMLGSYEIFKLPGESKQISAHVYFKNYTEQNVAIAIAAYNGNEMVDIKYSNSTIIEGYPTAYTDSVDVDENTSKVAVFVWDSLGHMLPISEVMELTAQSRDTRIKKFTLKLSDDGNQKMYVGNINHNNRTIDVYVPIADIRNNAIVGGDTKELATGANGYTSIFNEAYFFHAITQARYDISLYDNTSTYSLDGKIDLSTSKKISIIAEDGTCDEYTISVYPIGYIINSNMDKTTLRYKDSEITVKDTENAWKYEANNFVSTAANRNLAPSPMSSSGFWSYSANAIAIKDGWRYTKEDYTNSGNEPASNTISYSRLYTDISKKESDETDHYVEIVSQNDASQTSLQYNYTIANNDTFTQFKNNLSTLITSFDFTVKSGSMGSGIRFNNGLGEFAVRVHYEDDTKFNIYARGHYSDSGFNSKTKSAYTEIGTNVFDIGDWHNVKIISQNVGQFVSGKIAVVNSYYIDDKYIGYTYSLDKYSAMWNQTPMFTAFFNADCVVAIDNFFTGFYSQQQQLPDSVKTALASVESSYDRVIPWLANMYDSETGGFYLAKSGKDDPNMAPALEMTSWGIGIINSYTDSLDDMPEDIRQKFIDFYDNRQDPETGYYIDSQGPANDRETARNQSTSLNAMKILGATTKYPHPSRPQSTKVASTDSTILMRGAPKSSNTSSMPDYMASKEAYIDWIDSLDWENNPWSAGDRVQASQVYIQALSALDQIDYKDDMFDWFESHQNATSGLWGNEVNFNAVSGAFKVGLIYSLWDKKLPEPYKIVDSIFSCYRNCIIESPYYARNPVSLLDQLSKYNLTLRDKVRNGIVNNIDYIIDGINRYKCPDGAFSAGYKKSMTSFGGVLGSHGLYEGDMDATLMALITRENIYSIFNALPPKLESGNLWDWITGSKELPSLYTQEYIEQTLESFTEDFEEYEDNTVLDGTEFGGSAIKDYLSAKVVTEGENKVLALGYDGTQEAGPQFKFKQSEPDMNYTKITTEFDIKIRNANQFYINYGSKPYCALSFSGDGAQKISYRKSSSSFIDTSPNVNLEQNKWYSLKVEFELNENRDDATIKLYVDGVLRGTSSYYFGYDSNGSTPNGIDKELSMLYYKRGKGNILLDNLAITAE